MRCSEYHTVIFVCWFWDVGTVFATISVKITYTNILLALGAYVQVHATFWPGVYVASQCYFYCEPFFMALTAFWPILSDNPWSVKLRRYTHHYSKIDNNMTQNPLFTSSFSFLCCWSFILFCMSWNLNHLDGNKTCNLFLLLVWCFFGTVLIIMMMMTWCWLFRITTIISLTIWRHLISTVAHTHTTSEYISSSRKKCKQPINV